MVDKCTFIYSEMTAWNPWLWAPSEMTTGCYETSLLLFANARGPGTLLTVKCLSPGAYRKTNARGLPGGDARSWNWLAHNSRNTSLEGFKEGRCCHGRRQVVPLSVTVLGKKLCWMKVLISDGRIKELEWLCLVALFISLNKFIRN